MRSAVDDYRKIQSVMRSGKGGRPPAALVTIMAEGKLGSSAQGLIPAAYATSRTTSSAQPHDKVNPAPPCP